jgi:nucleotide-binding universal stress UspA family protein
MKALIGIDEAGQYKSGLCLLGRLRFGLTECTVEHVLTPLPVLGPPHLIDPVASQAYISAAETSGRAILDLAYDEACIRDMRCKKRLTAGNPAAQLVEDAKELDVDMVAVTATHNGRWATGFTGSVSRALSISSPCSVLVGKGEMNPGHPVRAVFAMDHSEYSEACLKELIRLKPAGLSHVEIVTAFHMNESEAKLLHRVAPGVEEKALFKILEEKAEKAADELAEAGITTSWTVVKGNPNDVLRQAMQNTHGDLMIVGAQGKGFVERLMLGSVSLHQVVCEPYPVLILRPKKSKV